MYTDLLNSRHLRHTDFFGSIFFLFSWLPLHLHSNTLQNTVFFFFLFFPLFFIALSRTQCFSVSAQLFLIFILFNLIHLINGLIYG